MDARSLYAALIAAWNDRDAAAFASLFADDGVTIGFDGSLTESAATIERELAGIFAAHPTQPYVVVVVDTRMLDATVEVLRARVGMPTSDGLALNPEVNAWQTIVVVDGSIALLQNTPAQYHGRADLAEEHTAALLATGTSVPPHNGTR